MKLRNICLVIILLTIILLINVEMAAAFTGENVFHGFWQMIKNLLNLLLFQTEDRADNSSETAEIEDDSSVEDWTELTVTTLTREEKEMLELINQVRSQHELLPLQINYKLVKIARAKSQDMVRGDYFAHHSPNYGSPFDMMQKLDIDYYLAGENIAGAPDVESAHQQLMKSKSHRENILEPDFTAVGIGIVSGGLYQNIFTQEFAGLSE